MTAALDGRGRRRVAITGVGVKSPGGNDADSLWSTLAAGRSTAKAITGFDPARHPVKFACEVGDFDPAAYFGVKEARRADRVTQLGVAAAVDAFNDAGSPVSDPARCAVVVGTGIGGLRTLEDQVGVYKEKGAERVSPFLVPMMMPNAAAATIGMLHGWTGPNVCVATACAAGGHALGEGARLIRDGSADVVLAGGTEAAVTPVAVAAFARMGALSTRHDAPALASRPFDVDRDGFVIGEGAAFFVLEPLDAALARRATIWGELAGYGRTCDAFHITAPAPGGAGASACMELALEDAGLTPADIGHVNAHGTSTPLNDAAESEAITKVFGDGAVPVMSAKGALGHLVGAAGAVEALVSLLALRHGAIPPTANHDTTDPALTIDVVAGAPRALPPAPVVSNSFGFGGHNATLVLTPPPTPAAS